MQTLEALKNKNRGPTEESQIIKKDKKIEGESFN